MIASDRSGRPVWHYWAAAAGLLALGGYLYLFISAIVAPPLPPLTNPNTVVMNALHVVGEHGSKLGWSFSADSSETSVDGALTTYKNVRDGTYFEHGKPAYHISANQVTLDTRSQNYSASGSVHIWAVTGEQPRDIKADSLNWSQPLQTLSFPNGVTVLYQGSSYAGRNLYVDFRDGSIHTGKSALSYHKKKS
ncbi:MAG TPA: hypothetical protein VJN22_03460 [Candidatus Eremiobacteraceae bacterium]|nr:hypothetical protein [Candidatus Eremiobacteraceae bacterium]